MAPIKVPFVIEGRLLEQWKIAQKRFLESLDTRDLDLRAGAELDPNPSAWLKSLQEKRHKDSSKFDRACTKVGKSLEVIQKFVQTVGFAVEVTASAVPAVAPASFVVSAFAWLFSSFAKVSSTFDTIEELFERLSSTFGFIAVNEVEALDKKNDLQECVVTMFACCLDICRIAFEQVKHRKMTWVKVLVGNGEFSEAMKKLESTEKQLRECISWKTLAGVDTLVRANSDLERDDILDWMSTLEHEKMHRIVKDQAPRNKKRGRWLLESELFERWRDQDVNRVWYTGDPGAGKSVLASIIIDHLRQFAKTRSISGKPTRVAFLYMSYTSRPEYGSLLGSILRQLHGDGDDFDEDILSKFRECRQQGKFNGKVAQPSADETESMLSRISKNKKAYIVIDALDECEYAFRKGLLDCIQSIQPTAKILVTSRILQHLDRFQEGYQTDKITAHDEDMDDYIGYAIKDSFNLRSFPELHGDIKTRVKFKSGKMFIIVRLHMEALARAETQTDLRNILDKLPDTIDGAYESTLDRIIMSTKKNENNVGELILGWVAHARRLLWMNELQYALAIDKTSDCTEKDVYQEDKLLSDCCGLVIRDIDNRVRFVHRSAQEFFDRRRDTKFPNFNARIAYACAKYLSMPSLLQHPQTEGYGYSQSEDSIESESQSEDSIESESQPEYSIESESQSEDSIESKFPLLRYAGEFLHEHHRQIGSDSKNDAFDVVRSLIQTESSRKVYSQLLLKYTSYAESLAVFGDSNGRTVYREHLNEPLPQLHVAVYLGNLGFVQSLIEEQVDLSEVDPYGQSALAIAISCGLNAIAGALLHHGAKVDLSTERDHIILLYAMGRNNKSAVEGFIRKPVALTMDEGFLKIMGLWLLIAFAFLAKAFSAMKILPMQSAQKRTPETNETEENSSGLILEKYRMLLESAYDGDLDVLNSLLDPTELDPIDLRSICQRDFGDDSRSEGSDGHKSIESRYDDSPSEDDDVSERESRNVVSTAIKEAFVKSACFLAVGNEKNRALEILLRSGVSPNLQDFAGQSLLHRATARNNEKLVRLLLENKANPNMRNSNGRTALLANADMKKNSVLQLLKDNGANMDLTHRYGCHELYEAAVFGDAIAVKFFLEKGVNSSIMNHFRWTPLHGAAANGHYECVRLLLKHNANPSAVSDTGETPLDFVELGQLHYDHILTGEKHYAKQIKQAKALSSHEKAENKDLITELLLKKNAKRSTVVRREMGYDEFNELKHSCPKYEEDGWWNKHTPYYRHSELS